MSVGHSNEKDRFYRILADNGVDVLADVRSHPTSKLEWARKAEMERELARFGIEYRWFQDLGGWTARHGCLTDIVAKHGVDLEVYTQGHFPKQRIARQVAPTTRINLECPLHGCPPVRPEKNRCICEKNAETDPFWYVIGFRDYSYYTMLPEFAMAAEQLVRLANGDNLLRTEKRVATCCQEYLPHKCHRSMIADFCLHKLGTDTVHLMDGRSQEHSDWPSRLERYDSVVLHAWDMNV